MKLKIFFALLIIKLLAKLIHYIGFFRFPFVRLFKGDIMDGGFDINMFINLIVEFHNFIDISSSILVIIGIVLCLRNSKIGLNSFISFFIYYSFLDYLFEMTTIFGSTNIDFQITTQNPFLKTNIIINLLFFIATVIFYSSKSFFHKKPNNVNVVSKNARLINYSIDTFIFIVLFFSNVFTYTLNGRPNFGNLVIVNSQIIYLAIFFRFVFYFSCEFLFGTTIGKLHNRSNVNFNDNRFKSILIRTLVRFIPFEAFTFLSKGKGLHDKISKTEVSIANKA